MKGEEVMEKNNLKGLAINNSKKNNVSGVTLISLVVTVIILIILAGISITALIGNNGLVNRTNKNSREYEIRMISEEILVDIGYVELQNKGQVSKENLEKVLEKQGEVIYDNDGKPIGVITEEKGYEILLEDIWDGEIYEKCIADLVNEGTIKVGDYVAYEPTTETFNWSNTPEGDTTTYATYSGSTSNSTLTTQTTLNWRVLDIVDGQVRLISDVPTTQTVYLQSYNGYNNAVYLLNKLCNTLYSKSGVGTAQSLKIEDIQGHMNLDKTTGGWDYNTYSDYGSTYSPTNKYYPIIFAQEKNQIVNGTTGTTYGLSEQTAPINQTTTQGVSSWTVKYTYWFQLFTSADITRWTDPMYYTLFINNGSSYPYYWIASRCVKAESGYAHFYVRFVGTDCVSGHTLYYSANTTSSNSYRVRPVVTLNSGITVDTTDTTKDGSTASLAWKLK